MLHGASEMQELLLQLRLFPRPNRRTVAMPRFLALSPCVSPEVFQQRGVGGGKRPSLEFICPFERTSGPLSTRQVAGQVDEQTDLFEGLCR